MQSKKLRASYEELQATVGNLQSEVLGLRQAYASTSEVLAAVVSLLGESSVQGEMERMRQERQDAQEAQQAAGVALLVSEHVLKPIPETTLNAFVVGTDTNSDGKKRRVQFELKEQVVPADIMPKFLGKKAGEVVENNGVTLTVVEVYEVDKARAAEFQVEQQKKAVEAATAAQAAAAPSVALNKDGEVVAVDDAGGVPPESAPAADAPQA